MIEVKENQVNIGRIFIIVKAVSYPHEFMCTERGRKTQQE